MKKTIKIIGLLILGAVLGQVLFLGLSFCHVMKEIKDPYFLTVSTMLSTAPNVMSNKELGIWNEMRDDMKNRKLADVNRLIHISKDELDFKVIPAKALFTQGEGVLAEIRFKNVSGHTLHINEPQVMKLTQEIYHYQGLNQLDYNVSISPLQSSWMRTLLPGEQLSIPILIPVDNTGSYKINYALTIMEFNEEPTGEWTEFGPTIKQTACTFVIQ
jgi:hypothetical protein